MCEENRTGNCNGCYGNKTTIVTIKELLGSAQKSENTSENSGCKFHPAYGI